MSYPAYPDYAAPSAALGMSYPKTWPIERLRFSILSNPVRSEVAHWDDDKLVSFVPMDAVGEQGGMDASQEKPIGDVYTGYTYFLEQDVVIAKITPCFENGKGAIAEGLKNGVGFGTTEFHVLRPLAGISNRWLFYLTMSDSFRKIGGAEMLGAGGQKRVPEDFIKNFRIGIPAFPEQQHIAAFLDWKTGQIDALIAKKQALMDKLKEKRLAVITQAVTKGLDPAAPMRDSGIAWLGAVPEHWEVMQLRRRWVINDCKHKTVSFVDDGVPMASIQEVHAFEVNLVGANKTTREEYFQMIEGGRKPEIGDILYSRNATVGDASVVTTTEIFCMGQDVCLLRSIDTFPRFVAYLLRSYPLREQADSLMIGSTFNRINVGQIKTLWVSVPPIEEQVVISAYLDKITGKIDLMMNKAESAIAHLTEYRTALITAATTGQIDVRQVIVPASARQLPKEYLSVQCPDDMMRPLP